MKDPGFTTRWSALQPSLNHRVLEERREIWEGVCWVGHGCRASQGLLCGPLRELQWPMWLELRGMERGGGSEPGKGVGSDVEGALRGLLWSLEFMLWRVENHGSV